MKTKFYFLLGLVLFNLSCKNPFYYTANKATINKLFSHLKYLPHYQTIKYNNDKINVVTLGDSLLPLLVIVHGAPGEWYNSFPNFLDSSLLDKFYIVTYDRPGYGKSSEAPNVASINYQTSVLEKVIAYTKYNNKKITLLARSYGTPIASLYAANHNAEVSKLVLVGSTTAPKLERIFWFSYLAKWGLAEVLLPKALRSATIEKFNHKAQLKIIEPFYKNITCNTYVLHGTKDWMADTANLYYNLNNFTNAHVVGIMLLNAPHNIIGYNPAYVKTILLDSL